MKLKQIAAFALILFSQSVFAKDHKVPTPTGSIIFQTGEAEKSQRKFFGADLWFTGSVLHDKRNVMSIVYSTSGIELDQKVSDAQYLKHKEEMQKFAKERGFTGVEFKPHKYQKINNELAYHSFVWSYKKDNLAFLEESYYVECKHMLFIAKATTHLESRTDQDKFKKIIESARCIK